jgi:aryl-alcohol dehydrogenase-like predicted oxidoreductase
MQHTTLGATGLKASVAGLGCGGNSRLGLGLGRSEAEAVALVRSALDMGVNLLDTAIAYDTEAVVGRAVAGFPRDRVIIATKSHAAREGRSLSGAEVVANLEGSLRRLGLDHVDIFQLHGVSPQAYDHAEREILPALLAEKAKGKLRHIGITETSPNDPEQKMLARATANPGWEVVMLAYSMMNQNARRVILPKTRERRVGTLMMFVVRNIFSKPDLLARTIAELAAKGEVPAALAESRKPLDFLVHEGGATSIIDAAYRFVRHEPGVDVVLFGTGSREHLATNIASILKPPLPASDVARLYELFGALKGVGLDLPDRVRAAKAG